MGKNIEEQSPRLTEEINLTDSTVFESPIRELEASDYAGVKKPDLNFNSQISNNSQNQFENTKKAPSSKIWKELLKFLLFVVIIAGIAILIGYFFSKKLSNTGDETFRGIIKKTDISKLNGSDYEKIELDEEYYEITTKNKDVINNKAVEKDDYFELQGENNSDKCTDSDDWDKRALGKNKLISDYLVKNKKNTRIAIIDSGINTDGNSLKENIDYKKSINIVNKKEGLKDESGHGTNVAMIIKSYIETEMVIIKITGKDKKISSIDTIKAINHAINSNVDVINISFGGGNKKIEALQKTIKKAEAKNIIVVGALSNDKKNNFPASYSGVIKTGSFGNDFKISEFSNPKSDLFFPGECLKIQQKNNIEGNSFATPILSSVILIAKIYQKKGDGVNYYINLIKENSYNVEKLTVVDLSKIINIPKENTKYVNNVNGIKKELEDINYTYLKELKEKTYKKEDIDLIQKNVDIFNKKYLESKEKINKYVENINAIYAELGIKNEKAIYNFINEIYIKIDKIVYGNKIVLSITNQNKLKETLGVDSCIENTNNAKCPNIKSELKSLNNLCQNKTAGGKNYICGIQVPIILSGAQLPATGSGVHVTIFDNQETLPITIFEGDSMYSSYNKKMGNIILEGLDKKQAGKAGGIVYFYVDTNGVLSVKVTDINNKNNEVESRIENIKKDSYEVNDVGIPYNLENKIETAQEEIKSIINVLTL